MSSQVDLFLDSLVDAPLRGDRALMEYPFFSISKTPVFEPWTYVNGDVQITVTPGPKGAANMWDKDALIYLASMINERIERGMPTSRRVVFAAHDFLRLTNKGVGKTQYERFKDSLFRLRSTTIETTIISGKQRQHRGFGWIETFEILEDEMPDGSRRMRAVAITINDWMYRAITQDRRVLAINRDYFKLKGGLERRLYELARKHCGSQKQWKIGLPALIEKAGSRQSLREFKRDLKKIIEADSIPDYTYGLLGDPASDVERELREAGFNMRAAVDNERVMVLVIPRGKAVDNS